MQDIYTTYMLYEISFDSEIPIVLFESATNKRGTDLDGGRSFVFFHSVKFLTKNSNKISFIVLSFCFVINFHVKMDV